MKSTVNEHYVKFIQYKSKKNSKDLIFQLTSIRNRGKMSPNIYGETHMNIHEYTYLDENEKPLTKEDYSTSGVLVCFSTYGENGRMTSKTEYDDNGVKTGYSEFDSDGQLVKFEVYNPDGTVKN